MPKRPNQGPCSVLGCGRPIDSKTWCGKHYRMQRLYGRTELKNKGGKRDHPLYSIWFERKQRGSLCELWASDFQTFVAAVGARPSPTHLLRRLDRSRAYQEGNWEWMAALKREKGESLEGFGARKWASRRERDPTYEPKRWLKRRYNITHEDYAEMLKAQGGVCAICKAPETRVLKQTGAVQALAVDHCHKGGQVRGLLCWRCNTTLGKVEDSAALLRAMIGYLEGAPVA